MEDVIPEMRRLVIAEFYRKNVGKGKSFTAKHFKRMGYKKTQVYAVMKRVDEGESVAQKEGQGRLRKPQLFRSIKASILTTANEGPYATFR